MASILTINQLCRMAIQFLEYWNSLMPLKTFTVLPFFTFNSVGSPVLHMCFELLVPS